MSKNTYIQTQVQNADIFLSLYQGAAQHMIDPFQKPDPE